MPFLWINLKNPLQVNVTQCSCNVSTKLTNIKVIDIGKPRPDQRVAQRNRAIQMFTDSFVNSSVQKRLSIVYRNSQHFFNSVFIL